MNFLFKLVQRMCILLCYLSFVHSIIFDNFFVIYGTPGTPGNPGQNGKNGNKGIKGHRGPVGPQGERGLSGPRGRPGNVRIIYHRLCINGAK